MIKKIKKQILLKNMNSYDLSRLYILTILQMTVDSFSIKHIQF